MNIIGGDGMEIYLHETSENENEREEHPRISVLIQSDNKRKCV